MASLLKRVFGNQNPSGPARVGAYSERGVSGTPIYAGYVRNFDQNALLNGSQRWRTASDILVNFSIVSAGIRYFLDLVAKPTWKLDPANDTDEAKEMAEFVEEVINDMTTSWTRHVRRSGMYRYHGFGIGEWTAKRREDGRIGLADIEVRPTHTIERWGTDDKGSITGVWQRNPMTGEFLWLPRSKITYLVDDMMTDSPEGLGWFRSLAEPSHRLKNFQNFESLAFERNLAGVPIGKAPLSEIQKMVDTAQITEAQATELRNGITAFIEMQAKSPNTAVLIDSAVYEAPNNDGTNFTSVAKWGIDLLKGDMVGIEDLGHSIERITREMALIIGVESLLIGGDGKGSLALSRDKSNNLYLVVNSTLTDMAEAFDRDIIDPIWALNGFPEELRPTLKTEDVAFKDVEQIAAMLRDMAAAGATLEPDDPAINDMRDLAGISRVPDEIIERGKENAMRPPPVMGIGGEDDAEALAPGEEQAQTGAEDEEEDQP
jgi:hypothetical protein